LLLFRQLAEAIDFLHIRQLADMGQMKKIKFKLGTKTNNH
jgi:hypothetical protein